MPRKSPKIDARKACATDKHMATGRDMCIAGCIADAHSCASGLPSNAATSAMRPPVQYGHLRRCGSGRPSPCWTSIRWRSLSYAPLPLRPPTQTPEVPWRRSDPVPNGASALRHRRRYSEIRPHPSALAVGFSPRCHRPKRKVPHSASGRAEGSTRLHRRQELAGRAG